jgi:hypothetical protein
MPLSGAEDMTGTTNSPICASGKDLHAIREALRKLCDEDQNALGRAPHGRWPLPTRHHIVPTYIRKAP